MTAAPWAGRRVLLTGHTGFKGAWLAVLLTELGAEVTGFGLDPSTTPSLWEEIGDRLPVDDVRGDLRDAIAVERVVGTSRPEVVLHLAAQALVPRSVREPAETFAVNVGGLVTTLEAVSRSDDVRAVLVVTSDKVYDERGTRPYDERSPLGGRDPYSASKACAELVAASYRETVLGPRGVVVATARSGNVIGGGDWSAERLVPDVVRAGAAGEPVVLRNPEATRPWQHVLDPLHGYLRQAEALLEGPAAGTAALNFGPAVTSCLSAQAVVEAIARRNGGVPTWTAADPSREAAAEAKELTLDARLATEVLGWRPALDLDDALDWTIDWYRRHAAGEDALQLTREQVAAYGKLVP